MRLSIPPALAAAASTPSGQAFLLGLRRVGPYAILLAILLGAAVSVGAHYSNASPSESRPFGWEGPANLDNGVAMVRSNLVLATTLPALIGGALLLRGSDPALLPTRHAGLAALAGGLAVGLAPFVSGALGAWAASAATWQGYWAFSVAHALLALAFYALALLSTALFARGGMVAAAGVWGIFHVLYNNVVQWRVMREAGYHRLVAGDFPAWFYAAQAFSPLTSYRGVLILWRPEMMDGLERAILKPENLPAWMTPAPFAALLILLWILLPIALGLYVWHRRGMRARTATPRGTPTQG